MAGRQATLMGPILRDLRSPRSAQRPSSQTPRQVLEVTSVHKLERTEFTAGGPITVPCHRASPERRWPGKESGPGTEEQDRSVSAAELARGSRSVKEGERGQCWDVQDEAPRSKDKDPRGRRSSSSRTGSPELRESPSHA